MMLKQMTMGRVIDGLWTSSTPFIKVQKIWRFHLTLIASSWTSNRKIWVVLARFISIIHSSKIYYYCNLYLVIFYILAYYYTKLCIEKVWSSCKPTFWDYGWNIRFHVHWTQTSNFINKCYVRMTLCMYCLTNWTYVDQIRLNMYVDWVKI